MRALGGPRSESWESWERHSGEIWERRQSYRERSVTDRLERRNAATPVASRQRSRRPRVGSRGELTHRLIFPRTSCVAVDGRRWRLGRHARRCDSLRGWRGVTGSEGTDGGQRRGGGGGADVTARVDARWTS